VRLEGLVAGDSGEFVVSDWTLKSHSYGHNRVRKNTNEALLRSSERPGTVKEEKAGKKKRERESVRREEGKIKQKKIKRGMTLGVPRREMPVPLVRDDADSYCSNRVSKEATTIQRAGTAATAQ
jgi:transcription initiation factor IIF auxiliary subunit